ncbi:MAG: S9 family peptidase [Anaerolineales bacterium]|jgi:dipeptidyl aminopeptidase/acylaminoacyl peptidase
MSTPITAPYGSWKSPITSDLIIAGTIGLGQMALDGDQVYWLEGRPTEGGRVVIVRRTSDGLQVDVLPPPYNARSRVHEYGGGAYTVHDDNIYFVNFSDQRIYQTDGSQAPAPLTPDIAWRYADLQVDAARERLICVREDHAQSDREAVNTLVAVPLDGSEQILLASGHDFYASPRLSPNGRRLAWLSWDHPNMPWDGTSLWVAEIDHDGRLREPQKIAGGATESIFQPEWSPAGSLYFISDRTGWWNLYHWSGAEVKPLLLMEAEFGFPQWVFGMSTYNFYAPDQIACAFTQHGTWNLALIDLNDSSMEALEIPYDTIDEVRAASGRLLINGASPTEPHSIVAVDPHSNRVSVLKRSANIELNPGYIAQPESIEFPTEAGQTAYGLFYPPRNRDYAAPSGEKPPLLVMSHGGPTSAADTALSLGLQYWTSRGFAVLDVNYGGSTGYGRPYRERLNGQWGVVDIDDCAHGAEYLVATGRVDGSRLAIRGGSAGGYTTLSALAFRDTFKAGASHFGVSDLEALATETHKFESRYLDKMVGPYPQAKDVYEQRSPIHHAQGLNAPVIFFQGLDDRVVPPNQAETLVAALRENGIPVAYIAYEGEGHGFRKGKNIKRTLDAELYFYQKVFGIPVDPDLEPIKIDNLP